jgi:hypothetical protein
VELSAHLAEKGFHSFDDQMGNEDYQTEVEANPYRLRVAWSLRVACLEVLALEVCEERLDILLYDLVGEYKIEDAERFPTGRSNNAQRGRRRLRSR